MAFRYRQYYPETGDILDPDDWVLGNAEIADEFNGYLDRDNIPDNAIAPTMVVANAMNALYSDAYNSSSPVTIDPSTVQWIDGDGTIDIGTKTIQCPVDCSLDCEWSGTVVTTLSTGPGSLRFRIVVDGLSIAESGWEATGSTEVGTSAPWAGYVTSSPFLNGATVVTAGEHTIKVQAQAAIPNSNGISGSYNSNYTQTENEWEIEARELVIHEKRR